MGFSKEEANYEMGPFSKKMRDTPHARKKIHNKVSLWQQIEHAWGVTLMVSSYKNS